MDPIIGIILLFYQICIIDECLWRKNISTLHYNGSLSSQQREDALNAFSAGEQNVMLITVGAGGEGITITAADRIIITDPNWNPTVDDQAIDRAYGMIQNSYLDIE